MPLLDFRIEVARTFIVDDGEDTDVSDREEDNLQKDNSVCYNNLLS